MADNVKATAPKASESSTSKAEEVKATPTPVPNGLKSEATIKAEVTEATKSEEAKLTDAEKKAIYDSLPADDFRQTIDKINKDVAEHNANNAKISAAEQNNPALIKAEIFENNPKKNAKLAALRKKELELLEAAEKLRNEAYGIIETEGLMDAIPTPEEIEKLKANSSESLKTLRNQVETLKKFEEMIPTLKGKLLPLVDDITTRKGAPVKATGTGTLSGEKARRPRFRLVTINGETTDKAGNTVFAMENGKEKYTSGTVMAFLRKQRKGFDVSTAKVTNAYFAEIADPDNVPDVHTFTIYDEYVTESGHQMREPYVIQAYKPLPQA